MYICSKGYTRDYKIHDGRTERSIQQIIVYDGDKELFRTVSGWFSKKIYGDVGMFEIPQDSIKSKKTVKFDGTCFLINHGKDMFKEYKSDLYIPNSYLNFKHVKRMLGVSNCIIDRWVSETIDSKEDIYRHDLNIDLKLNELEKKFKSEKDKYEFRIDEDSIFDSLKTLKDLAESYLEERERIENLPIESFVAIERFSLEQLMNMDNILQTDFENLKYETDTHRVYLSRCTVADGEFIDNLVTVKQLIDGNWIIIDQYGAK